MQGLPFFALAGVLVGFKISGGVGVALGLLGGGFFGAIVDRLVVQYAGVVAAAQRTKNKKRKRQ